jgi:hypothetical protein
VSFRDWLEVDGYDLILSRVASDIESRLESALKSLGLPLSVLYSQTPKSIISNYIKADGADKRTKALEPKFVDLQSRLDALSRCSSNRSTVSADLISEYDGIVRNCIKELMQHRMTGYYFLPNIVPDEPETGFVVLLREVTHLPRQLARLIAAGVDMTDQAFVDNKSWLAYVDFVSESFAMPIGEIKSPQIEHLMQTFAQLFGRIGLPDLKKDLIDRISDIRPLSKGAAA